MIKIERIEIEEFRGIRKLALDLKGKSFAICGPNGTGKSGIVDAIEFALTGSISRLTGRGTGDVSVEEHAPHVDSRNRPDKAKVILTAKMLASGKTFTIERSVKKSDQPIVTPNEPAILALVAQVSSHPEFVLSRRELISYILATPGDRSKEIQALLRMDDVESLRTVLLRIANSDKKAIGPLKAEADRAVDGLIRALGIVRLDADALLEAANSRRKLLNLAEIKILTSTTSIKDGLNVAQNSAQGFRIAKAQAIQDVQHAKTLSETLASEEKKKEYTKLAEDLRGFVSDPVNSQAVSREAFLKSALLYVLEGTCPVCDTVWDPLELKEAVQIKIKQYEAISAHLSELQGKLEPVAVDLENFKDAIKTIRGYNLFKSDGDQLDILKDLEKALGENSASLRSLTRIGDAASILEGIAVVSSGASRVITETEKIVSEIPEPSEQDTARDFLTIAQEKLETYRSAQHRLKIAEDTAALSAKINSHYILASNEVLEKVYKDVESEFSALYRDINKEDESGFSAKLLPSAGKLGFDVDFYGKGFFPPGAYHSEGHQDGMGFCLYLALMKHLLGKSFVMAVLDDVLMSVDSGHRREVCSMLKKHFPDTQFILTTHDPVWLRHMRTEGLIGDNASIRFRTWDVEHGPTKWDDRDVWQEIEDYRKAGDVRASAGLLRHFLEYIFAEICHRLRVPVEFRGDAQYQLGDLLPSAVSGIRKHYDEAVKAARKWNNEVVLEILETREKDLAASLNKTNYDHWQINGAVHFNDWDNLTKEDFAPVASAFQGLVGHFYCPTCSAYLEVIPNRGPVQVLKCVCGELNFNLKSRPEKDAVVPFSLGQKEESAL